MRLIIKRRELVSDPWRYPGESEGGGPAALPLAEFLEAVRRGSAPASGIGIWMVPTDEVEALAAQLHRVQLVIVHFPKDGEGRGFSQGRLLRERYRFTGELRAAGPIKRDYMYLLARCGFDAFDLHPGEDLQAAIGALATFSVAYQPGDETLVQPRHRPRLYGAESSNL
jgi:uncharacterized protein (DUF934 family)